MPMKDVLAELKIELEMGDYLKLLPHIHQTDGFFAARVRTQGSGGEKKRGMKWRWLALWLLALPHAHAFDVPLPPIAAQGTVQALFSPWENIESAIVEAIGNAKQQVLVQAYLLTSKRIAVALIAAHRRGADVRVLVDANQLDKVETSRGARSGKSRYSGVDGNEVPECT